MPQMTDISKNKKDKKDKYWCWFHDSETYGMFRYTYQPTYLFKYGGSLGEPKGVWGAPSVAIYSDINNRSKL